MNVEYSAMLQERLNPGQRARLARRAMSHIRRRLQDPDVPLPREPDDPSLILVETLDRDISLLALIRRDRSGRLTGKLVLCHPDELL